MEHMATGKSKVLWTCRNARWILRYIRYDTSKDIDPWDIEAKLDPPELIDEQLDLVIQFGFVTLFAASFPLAALIALGVDLLSVRVTALVWLKYKAKPDYKGAAGLGIHYQLMQLISVLAIVNNFLLIGFSYAPVHDLYERINPGEKYQSYYFTALTIFGLEHVMLVIKWLIGRLLPPVPEAVRVLRAKNEFIRQQTIKKAIGGDSTVTARQTQRSPAELSASEAHEKQAILELFVGSPEPSTSTAGTSSSV